MKSRIMLGASLALTLLACGCEEAKREAGNVLREQRHKIVHGAGDAARESLNSVSDPKQAEEDKKAAKRDKLKGAGDED